MTFTIYKAEFTPQLFIRGGVKDISFYLNAFGAKEIYQSRNDAGAIFLNPACDYDYVYRQGDIQDPFGHQWMIEMKI
jgi:uncharacterized glyoxalase superfamily protein PhnB